jgi:hypothetical protein
MKLTKRGNKVVFISYVALILGLVYLIIIKPTHCLDEYTAKLLTTNFLYGEGEQVDYAIQAIYNNGGWIEITNEEEQVIFPCVTISKQYDEIEFE